MNYSYLMGIKDINILRNKGFIIKEIGDDYDIAFTKDKEKEYEEFVIENLEPGYWNEYLGDRFVFIFKYLDNTVKKYIHTKDNEQEIFELCCKFAEYKFPSFIEMLLDNEFYEKNYFRKNEEFTEK